MSVLKIQLHKLSQSHYGKIFLVLVLFLFLSLVSLFVFYNGYLINFRLINEFIFFENIPAFLEHKPYHSFSILFSSLLHPYFLAGLSALYFPVIFFRKSFLSKEFVYQKSERLLVFAAAFLLTWELVTYDYNYYLGSAFYFDRILLIILTLALLRFPMVTPLFIAFAFVYRSQFNYPVSGFELYDKRLLFDILIMFVAFRYMKAFVAGFRFSFVWLVLCVVASNYFYTGIAKITMSPHGYEWVTQNNLSNLFLNVHLRGWMAGASDETIHSVWNFFNSFHTPLQILVLIIELSALFLLRSKKATIIILSASFLMHIGIFICGSMLFWKWMIIDALLIYLITTGRNIVEEIRYRIFFGTSVIIIVFAFAWLRPLMIGWFDTPVNQFFTYEVEDNTGKTYQLTKNEMNPYHQWFQYDHFIFLADFECLSITGFGYTHNYELFSQLDTISENGLKYQCRSNYYNPSKTEAYLDFIRVYFMNRNKLLGDHLFLTSLRAPYHLYGTAKGLLYNDQAPVTKFRVIYNLTFSSSGKTIELEKGVLHEVAIPE